MTYKTMTYCFLLVLTLVCCSNNSREKKIDKEYQIIYLQKTFEEIGIFNNETEQNESDEENIIISTDYIGLFTNDSITIYNLQGGNSLFYITRNPNSNLTIRCEIDKHNTDSLIYQFKKKDFSISVNSNKYYLTKPYFEYLYEQGYNKLNILPLISLFITNIECFPSYSILIDNLWFPRKMKNEFKIIRSEITTNCGYDSSINYKWKVTYSYDENGRIDEVNKISLEENDSFLDILMSKKNEMIYSYDIFHIDEDDRYSEDLKMYINEEQLTDSIYYERQQNGYTYKFITKTLKRKAFETDKSQLTEEIIEFIIENEKNNCR